MDKHCSQIKLVILFIFFGTTQPHSQEIALSIGAATEQVTVNSVFSKLSIPSATVQASYLFHHKSAMFFFRVQHKTTSFFSADPFCSKSALEVSHLKKIHSDDRRPVYAGIYYSLKHLNLTTEKRSFGMIAMSETAFSFHFSLRFTTDIYNIPVFLQCDLPLLMAQTYFISDISSYRRLSKWQCPLWYQPVQGRFLLGFSYPVQPRTTFNLSLNLDRTQFKKTKTSSVSLMIGISRKVW